MGNGSAASAVAMADWLIHPTVGDASDAFDAVL